MNWCMDCGIRIVNEPNTEIYCAQCEAKYNKEIGKPLTFEWLESIVDSADFRGMSSNVRF